jgi:hypothetical protein
MYINPTPFKGLTTRKKLNKSKPYEAQRSPVPIIYTLNLVARVPTTMSMVRGNILCERTTSMGKRKNIIKIKYPNKTKRRE